MESGEDRRYLTQSGIMLFGAVALLAIHYILADSGADHDGMRGLLVHIPRELAIALFVASFLNFFLERNTQRRHARLERHVQQRLAKNSAQLNEQIRHNMLRTIFKRNVGDHVLGQIERKLLEPAPYRLEADLVYTLDVRTDADGEQFVLVSMHFRYKYFNPSTRPARWPLGMQTVSPRQFSCHLALHSLKCDGTEMLKPELAKTCVQDGNLDYQDVHGVEIGTRATKVVEVSATRADYLEAVETFVTSIPVEALQIVVHHPDNFVIDQMSLHPDDAVPVSNGPRDKIWTLKGLLPGQGFSFWWRPRTTATGGSTIG